MWLIRTVHLRPYLWCASSVLHTCALTDNVPPSYCSPASILKMCFLCANGVTDPYCTPSSLLDTCVLTIVSQLDKCLKFTSFLGLLLYSVESLLSPRIDLNFRHLSTFHNIMMCLLRTDGVPDPYCTCASVLMVCLLYTT